MTKSIIFKVLSGKHAGKKIRLSKPDFLVGRGKDCDLRVASDNVSRCHCLITISNSQVGVEDQGSKNGTLVNGERIIGVRPLAPGDCLKIGPMQLQLMPADGSAVRKAEATQAKSAPAAKPTKPAETMNVDEEVLEWLVEPDSTTSASMTETQSLRLGDTKAIKLRPTAPDDQDEDVTKVIELQEEEQPAEKSTEKTAPGKLPKIEKPQSKDSGEAAAKILDQFTRRR